MVDPKVVLRVSRYSATRTLGEVEEEQGSVSNLGKGKTSRRTPLRFTQQLTQH